MAESTAATNHHLVRSTVIVIVSFAAAKLISLAQTFIIARIFGVSAQYDTYVIANRIPEQIFNLIAGGAIAFAFIPVFTGMLARGEVQTAWKTASHIINTLFTVTLVVSIFAFIFAPWLIGSVVAPGFDAASQAQTVELMRILLISTLIFSVSGLSMGILQSHNRFLLPSLAPIMFDLGILFGAWFLVPGMGIHGIAVGAVIGAALHFAVQVPGLIQVRMRWTPGLGWNDPNLRMIIRLMIPRVLDLGVIAVTAIVSANILSRLEPGSASAYDWGWRIMQIPETLVGTAMGVVIFPTLAALSSVGNVSGKRDAMSGALRFILIATIPSAIGLIVIGRPLISLLERGAFDASASALVFTTLQFFAIGIIFHSLLEVVARSFYADKDTMTPLWAAIGGAVINIVFAILLSGVAQSDPTNLHGSVGGLALANTLGVTFEVVALAVVLRRRWNGLNENVLALTTLKTFAASLAMALAILVVEFVIQRIGLTERGFLWTVIALGIEVTVGVLVFIGAALALKMDELRTLIALVLRRRRMPSPPAPLPQGEG